MPKPKVVSKGGKSFHMEFKNASQKMAWTNFENNDILFLIGPAGTGKSFLACSFAINEVLARKKDRIIIARPIVEAGENLGFLKGTLEEKVHPYLVPLYDCIGKIVGYEGPQRERINRSLEMAPLAFIRGRAQPLDAKVLTPTGYVQMGDIKVGDLVISSNGTSVPVTGVYPQGKKEVFKVSFSDGSSTECCGEHLWFTQTLNEKRHGKGFSVKQTSEMQVLTKHRQKIHKIPLVQPVQFNKQEVSVDPYLLGLLLGDGHIRRGAAKFTTADAELITEISQRLPDGMRVSPMRGYDFNLVKKEDYLHRTNPLIDYLGEMGLVGKKSYEKFIPESYKFNCVNVRLEVLRGLLDTDGWIGVQNSGTHRIQFSSTSERLAQDVQFIVQSLGGIAVLRKREYTESDEHLLRGRTIRHARASFVVEIVLSGQNPFRLHRKSQRFTSAKPIRLISSIEPIGEKECQCIKVDSEDHLYVTDNFILTHNTFDDAVCILDEAQNATWQQILLFLTRMGENCKLILTGDPKQSDLRGDVALVDFVQRLQNEPGIGVMEFSNSAIVRHPLVGRILELMS